MALAPYFQCLFTLFLRSDTPAFRTNTARWSTAVSGLLFCCVIEAGLHAPTIARLAARCDSTLIILVAERALGRGFWCCIDKHRFS